MKSFLIIILLIISESVCGQSKNLLGKYTQSFFMYKFTLMLKDSSQFVIEEDSDMGLRTTIGTWAPYENILELRPTKVYSSRGGEKPVNIDKILIGVYLGRLKVIAPKKTDMTAKNQFLEKIEN